MFNKKEKNDEEIREELEEAIELSDDDLEKVTGGWDVYNGGSGDTREYYSMNAEDINRSIFGSLLSK